MPDLRADHATQFLKRGRGRLARFLPLFVLLLASLVPTGCGEADPEERDLLLEYVETARLLRFDSGLSSETLYRGDSLVDFLDRFDRETFRPGPRSVRIESDCHPGLLTIGRRSYPVALCTIFKERGATVMAIDMDTVVLRLRRR